MRSVSWLVCGLVLSTGAAAAELQAGIGSWVLACPGSAAGAERCLLRLDKRFLDKAGITGDVEVMADGQSLVPVVALRGLPGEVLMAASLAGATEVTMQFAGGPRQGLDCAPAGAAYICAPHDDARRTLAAGLPLARSATVRVSVAVAGMKPLPVREKSIDLADTNEALARLRAAGPARVPGPLTALASQSPGGLVAMADRALKAAGYPNGIADLWALLGK